MRLSRFIRFDIFSVTYECQIKVNAGPVLLPQFGPLWRSFTFCVLDLSFAVFGTFQLWIRNCLEETLDYKLFDLVGLWLTWRTLPTNDLIPQVEPLGRGGGSAIWRCAYYTNIQFDTIPLFHEYSLSACSFWTVRFRISRLLCSLRISTLECLGCF